MNLMTANSFVILDLETSGLDRAFQGPVEIGAVVADANLQPIREINHCCRPPSFVLPEPGALVATGRSIVELMSRPVSEYQAACRFAQEVHAATPTCWVTYNGVKFDDHMIQHALYRNGFDPYMTLKGGNCRIDMLRLVQAAHALGLGDLVVPISDAGKPTFKLDRIAPLNGFTEAGAHTALVDARAAHHLARRVADRAPGLWDRARGFWSRKDRVRNFINGSDFIVEFSWDWQKGRPSFKALVPLAAGRSYAGDYVCLDLAFDPSEYTSLAPVDLVDEITIGPKPRPICRVRLNGVPIIFNGDDPLVSGRVPVEPSLLGERIRRIRHDVGLRERVLDAVDLSRDAFEEPEHVEQQLVSGGFITDGDMAVLKRFHEVGPEDKLQVARRLNDLRLNYLAERLIYEEWPWALPRDIHDRIDAERRDRHLSKAECPWTTVSAVLAEIEKQLPDADNRGRAILTEYREYLMRYAAAGCARPQAPPSWIAELADLGLIDA
jgi:exodeoxyribonuclease-1